MLVKKAIIFPEVYMQYSLELDSRQYQVFSKRAAETKLLVPNSPRSRSKKKKKKERKKRRKPKNQTVGRDAVDRRRGESSYP